MTRRALNPISFAAIIVILYMTMPILSVFISTYITTYAYMLLTVFLVLFIMLTGGINRLTSMIYVLAPMVIYIVCTLTTRSNSVLLWGYQSMLFVLPVIIGYYFFRYRPENAKIFSAIIIIAVVITMITTIIGVIEFPSAARVLATISEAESDLAVKYSWYNIGGYDFIYIAVLLYPVFILSYKLGKINAFVFFIGAILLFVLITFSEYTTALILIMLTSLLYFVSRRISSKHLMLIGLLFFLAILLLWPLFSKFLFWFADIIKSDVIATRIRALAGGYIELQKSDDSRVALYAASLNGFFSSPFFGGILGAEVKFGGHSFILDSLANYGIIGGAAIVLIYRNIYRIFFRPFSDKEGYGFILWAFTQAIILSVVNTGMWLNVLALFIPVILSSIYEPDSEENYENSLDS